MQIILTRTVSQSYGATFGRRGSQIEVVSIAHLSIAHLAGLKVGDVITRFNNQPCANLSVTSIELLMTANAHMILEVNRTPVSAQQTTQNINSSRQSIPSGQQVIELDSEDDDEDDEDDTIHFRYSDENSDELTDEDEDEFEARRRILNRLQTNASFRAQPQLQRAPAPAAVRRPVIPYNRGEVVDLLSDDDEPPARTTPAPTRAAPLVPSASVVRPPTAPARSLTLPAASSSSVGVAAGRPVLATAGAAPGAPGLSTLARAATTSAAHAAVQNTPNANATDVSGAKRALDSTPTSAEPAKRRKITVNGVEIKVEFEPKKFGEANVADEVIEVAGEEDEVVAPTADVEMVVVGKPAASTNAAGNDEESDFEDFQIVGGTMQVASDMPHQRYACTMHPFRMAPAQYNAGGHKQTETASMFAERCRMNIKSCAKCYCYVCDMLVTQCAEWPQHCHATHKEARWKTEKDSRNSKVLSLMSPQHRAAFFLKYKDALSATAARNAMSTSSYESDEDDAFMAEYGRMVHGGDLVGSSFASFGGSVQPSANPKDLSNSANLLNLVQSKLVQSKALTARSSDIASGGSSALSSPTLKPSSSSGAFSDSATSSPRSGTAGGATLSKTDKDVFLEASELLMRAITSPRHAGDAPLPIARAFVTWFMNPLCSLDLRTIVKNEMIQAQARSMVLTSSLYQGLKELVHLDNASVIKLRTRSEPSAPSTLPPQLLTMSEQVQALLIPELLDLGNFAAIKLLVLQRPSLVPSLLLYHIRNGSAESCKEGVALVYQYCQYSAHRTFDSLRPSIQDIELPKLFKFLAAVLAHNMTVTASTPPSSKPQLRQLHDSVTDVLFRILFTKIYDTIKIEHAAVIASSIDAYIARESSAIDPIRLDNVLSWIDAETEQTYNYSPLVIVLYLKYSIWRANSAIYAPNAAFSVIPPMINTPAVYTSLRYPLLVVLANAFCKHFEVSPTVLDTADIHAGVHMGCHIAARAFGMLSTTQSRKLTDFDRTIREAWMTLPELRKASPGEMCSANATHAAQQATKPAYCMVVAADNHTVLRFCPTHSFSTKNAQNRPAVDSWNSISDSNAPMRITATYCDVHHTYDTFLMSLVVPKNVVETRIAVACWGHQLQLHDLTYLPPLMELQNTGPSDFTLHGYIAFLVNNKELLYILWKGLLRQMYAYMHAMYHVEIGSMAALLSSLARIIKPYVSEVDAVSVNQLSSHPQCRSCSQTQLVELQAIDLNLRIAYQFSKFISKVQNTTMNGTQLTLHDVRGFKSSIPRFDASTTTQNLSGKMCQLYLLEYPAVSTRAIWHSFWRRFLLCLVAKRTYQGTNEAHAEEDLAIRIQLESWDQVRELIAKAPGMPKLARHFVSALALLQASDVTAMSYGGVSGSQVLRIELEKVLRIKYTVPVLQESPLTHISDKCLECPDSALAHLVLQLSPDLLQYGSLDYQPYFTFALQKKVDTSATSILATTDSITALNSCYKLCMRAHEDCVAIFNTSGRNMSISYTKVLCGLACLRRYDLVGTLVAAGYDSLALKQTPLLSAGEGRLKIVVDTLMLAHSRADFEVLLEVLDPFISAAYALPNAYTSMAPVIRKFCPLAELQIHTSQSSNSSTGGSDSQRIKLLRFYHAYDAPSFTDYWRGASRTVTEKAHILGWMQTVQNTPRFRTAVHLSVLAQLLDAAAFGAYLNGPELENPSIDKLVVFNTLLQLLPSSPGIVPMLVTATVRILLNISYLSDSMRASLSACCTELSLPPAIDSGTELVPGYRDARTLLLFVANPSGSPYVDALANVYAARTPKERENMCKVLFSKDKPSALIKLLLRIRDYSQLFRTLTDAYFTSLDRTELPSAQTVCVAIDEIRTSVTMNNLYSESAAGSSAVSAFQKQLFDEASFTVGLAGFILVLTEHHIDDRTVDFAEPLSSALNNLLNTIRHLVHGDAVVMSYLQMHVKFTTASALQFFNDCAACNYANVPFTPTAQSKTRPSTLCLDAVTAITRAPKFYTTALSYITVINFLARTLTQNVIKSRPVLSTLLSYLVNRPCRYRRDGKKKTSLASKGLLWIPKTDSDGAAAATTHELVKLMGSFGADLVEVLEEPILLRLWAGEVVHKFDNLPVPAAPAGGIPRISLKDWYAHHSDLLLRIVEKMAPAASYAYLLDLMGLYINFNFATFVNNLHQALSRPYAHLYRKIILNLLVHAITFKSIDLKVVLKVLCHEFHHPDNHYGLYFTEPELNLVIDYLQSSDELTDRARLAIMTRDGTPQVPLNSLLKIPRILELITKDFTKEMAYDSFGALHHASFFLTMWKELANTAQAAVAFQQANDCFRAIAQDFRSRTVQARLRTIFEGLLPHYKVFLDLFPDRAVEVKAIKAELRQILKSKPALVKALLVLN